jgi:hypothetical protein
MTRVEAVEIQRIHDAHKLAGGIEDDPNLEHHTNGEPGIKPCMCSDCCTQRQQAKESCARCFEAPRRNDPGMSNGLCVFCGYWDIPPGPTREAMRAKRDAQ